MDNVNQLLEGAVDTAASGITNQFFYQAYQLNRNERTNQRGIELIVNYDPVENLSAAVSDNYTLRAYVELSRVARLNDGVMDIFFS